MQLVMPILYLAMILFLWTHILQCRSRKQHAGRLLFVLGRPDGRLLQNFLGAIGVTLPILTTLAFGFLRPSVSAILFVFAFLTLALFWFISGRSKLQLRENGILDFTGLLKWQDIVSTDWEGRSSTILVIRHKEQPEWIQIVPFMQILLSKTIYLFWDSRIVVSLSPSAKDVTNSILNQFIAVDHV